MIVCMVHSKKTSAYYVWNGCKYTHRTSQADVRHCDRGRNNELIRVIFHAKPQNTIRWYYFVGPSTFSSLLTHINPLMVKLSFRRHFIKSINGSFPWPVDWLIRWWHIRPTWYWSWYFLQINDLNISMLICTIKFHSNSLGAIFLGGFEPCDR